MIGSDLAECVIVMSVDGDHAYADVILYSTVMLRHIVLKTRYLPTSRVIK